MARGKRTQDRPYMDASGAPPVEPEQEAAAKNFLAETADDDRLDAKAKHANKGLRTAKDLIKAMQKAVEHGLSSETDEVKRMCLEEVADNGNAVRDACRAAMRTAGAEKRNLQPSKKDD